MPQCPANHPGLPGGAILCNDCSGSNGVRGNATGNLAPARHLQATGQEYHRLVLEQAFAGADQAAGRSSRG